MTPEERKPEEPPVPSTPPKEEGPKVKEEEAKKAPEKKVEGKKTPEPYTDIKLFDGETVKLKANPHPLSFMHYYVHGVMMLFFGILFAILFASPAWSSVVDALRGIAQMFGGNVYTAAAFVLWGSFMLLYALAAWKVVDDVGGWYAVLYVLILVLAVVFEYFTGWDYRYLIPIYMIILAVLMLIIADRYRRAFRYYVTNMRIALIKRFITHDEIFLRYRNIVDVDVHQGFWARLFGYGTIIPITPSGIGTGSDSVTISGDAARGDLLEKGVHDDRIVSTTRSVATSRAKPDECLYGIKDPFGVKVLVSEMMDALSEDTQLREIRGLLQSQKDGK